MTAPARILVVDDEAIALNNLIHVLSKEGYQVTGKDNGPDALAEIEKTEYELVVTDLKMEKVDGLQILKRTRELHANAEVIMITGFATIDSAIEAMKEGAFHYIAKPYKLDEVRKVVREAVNKTRLRRENLQLKDEIRRLQGQEKRLITNNTGMKQLLDTASRVAITDCNVLISGESGTGKELLARHIHDHSRRRTGPLLSINCGVFSEELLANELFGHEKGSYTGATEMKRGLVEMAHGGTLFLDEITEMSPAMQVKLLRVVQEREVMRIGSTSSVKVDVRFVSATNRDIKSEVEEGHFRQDLFFRINVVSLELPPLAARKDDIPLLAGHFLTKYAADMHKDIASITPEALAILADYDFPGNVRELENIIERGVALATDNVIGPAELPDDIRYLKIRTFRRNDAGLPSLSDQEKSYIEWLLGETNGNKTECAKVLGIDRVSLWRKMKKYGLE